MMKKIIILLLLSFNINALNLEASITNHSGQSSYNMINAPVVSILKFPFNFNSINLSYINNEKNYKITVSTMINDVKKTGLDYDYINNNLAIYSESNSTVDKFYTFGISTHYTLKKNLSILAAITYKKLSIVWSNTVQQEAGNTIVLNGKSLLYEQDFIEAEFTLNYDFYFNKDIIITTGAGLSLAIIGAKDTHLLRDFYTLQGSLANGYNLSLKINKKISNNSIISADIFYTNYDDSNNNINFYFNNGLRTTAASYKYNNTKMSISYNFIF